MLFRRWRKCYSVGPSHINAQAIQSGYDFEVVQDSDGFKQLGGGEKWCYFMVEGRFISPKKLRTFVEFPVTISRRRHLIWIQVLLYEGF